MFHECESNIINCLLMMVLWPNRQDKVLVSLACPVHFKLLKSNSVYCLLSILTFDLMMTDIRFQCLVP